MNDPIATAIKQKSQPMDPQPTMMAARLPQLQGVRAILWDIYGTLFISGSGDVGTAAAINRDEALLEALDEAGITRPAGITADDLESAIKQLHARAREQGIEFPEVDILQIWREVLTQHQAKKISESVVTKLALAYEFRVNPVWPMPGLVEVLQVLQGRGMSMGVVSNAQFFTPHLFPALTGRTLMEWGISESLCAWSWIEGVAKPCRSLFMQVLDRLGQRGISPEEVLFVGNDLRNDIWPATELGCRTALFAGDARSLRLRESDEQVCGLQPDLVITELPQLLHVLA